MNGIFGITSRGGDGKKGQDGGNGAAGRDSGHRVGMLFMFLNFLYKPFHSRDQQLCKFIGTKRGFYIKKGSTHTGLVWDTNMAFVSFFSWDVKIDLPTSC